MSVGMSHWNNATAQLPWGVQRMVIEALTAVKEGQINMCWGADVRDGAPCLVNSIGSTVVATNDGKVSPISAFHDLVVAFDKTLSRLADELPELQKGFVSPLAAEILLSHFGPIKEAPELITEETVDALTTAIFESETSDAAAVMNWIENRTK